MSLVRVLSEQDSSSFGKQSCIIQFSNIKNNPTIDVWTCNSREFAASGCGQDRIAIYLGPDTSPFPMGKMRMYGTFSPNLIT